MTYAVGSDGIRHQHRKVLLASGLLFLFLSFLSTLQVQLTREIRFIMDRSFATVFLLSSIFSSFSSAYKSICAFIALAVRGWEIGRQDNLRAIKSVCVYVCMLLCLSLNKLTQLSNAFICVCLLLSFEPCVCIWMWMLTRSDAQTPSDRRRADWERRKECHNANAKQSETSYGITQEKSSFVSASFLFSPFLFFFFF